MEPADNALGSWILAAHIGDLNGVSGSWLQPDSVLPATGTGKNADDKKIPILFLSQAPGTLKKWALTFKMLIHVLLKFTVLKIM